MQHYLEDGIEIIDVIFDKEDVEAYKKILPIEQNAPLVPVLYLASIWPKFSMFERFIEKEIYLKETSIDEFIALDVDTIYKAKLKNEKIKKVKSFTIYEFSLTITSGDDIYTRLKQTFVGK
ncbi:hypothetical protein MUA77_09675 [Mammaliicoccus sciuri]|uniref:hypothetical protein n=1 Tax=Mammaliicoccus sciuri TaxID=1296 RepID=UPI0021D30FDC|nr:hypothetical protein [Mammaliicoccus sciuri]UXU83082.1 hypothetical protein MUA77_09675 [Mammaliicoccus sciuri]UXU92928.1 hypothetical protein MUA42_09685 [Mammaliicoccus sciuri]UXV14830.1 hypothetical protein MUA89_09685 [Mammaliicoccus sciuri]UXV23141.1 hypothetical protein MUA49_09680 [Mammaliicoccus sciuri]UXV25873.1 hypothetical protein MUA96_09680 [Mammaliicoccus sciuri]